MDDPKSDEVIPRKAYEAPRIEESARFETLALACAQAAGTICEYDGDPMNS